VQRTPDGTLIVVGPDGPTLGGYEVVGHVGLASLAGLAQRPPGSVLDIFPVSVQEAWQEATGWWQSVVDGHRRLVNLAVRD
jgi:allophanate hydrolase subunit 2